MKTRWARKHRRVAGIALAEALVSLTIAAMTLALLTSATWGLRQTAAPSDSLQNEATDWLTARRALQSWTAAATLTGLDAGEGRFSGTPVQSRDSAPMMVGLDVVEQDGQFALTASRYFNIRDIRLASQVTRQSTVVVTDTPLRFVYQVKAGNNGGNPGW